MMMETRPAQDWDVIWDYTMGLPEENGFEKIVEGSPSIEMTRNGLIIIPSGGYVRYTPIGFETCNEGVYEEKIIYGAFDSNNGNRIILSNGTYGLQIFVIGNSIIFNNGMDNSRFTVTRDIKTQKEYTIRIERIGEINKIYLDGDKIYETEVVSGAYAAGNRIFFQTAGEYLLKSIKFKKIS